MPRWRLAGINIVGSLMLTCFCSNTLAQSFESRHQRDSASNPIDLHFRIAIAGSAQDFHIGERIPLSLEFWSDSPDKYKLNGATYDRSGRLPTEEFVLERDDAADPYADYFGTGLLGGLAGGLRGYPVLDVKPYTIQLEANDWFRFDRPGVYRLYLKSHRLSRERAPGESGDSKTIQFAAVSNILDLHILPDDPAWTAAKLREIEAALVQPEPEMPKPGGPPVPVNPLEDKLATARRDLRYLANAAAVELAFQDARKLDRSPDTLLLIGAKDRGHAVATFDRYLANPKTNIGEWDIRVRALFRLLQAEKPKALPMFAWQIPPGTDLKQFWADAEERGKRFNDLVRSEAIRLIPIAQQKEKEARKILGEAIAALAPVEAKAALLAPPDDYGLTRTELIAQLPKFPAEQQAELLGTKWDLIRGKEIVPSLKLLVNQAKPKDLPDGALALQAWGAEAVVADTALQRLYELVPQEAYRIVANDIASGRTRFAGFAARELTARDMPEADATFARWLRDDRIGVLPLVGKFGTARLAVQMRKWYLAQSWPCAEEESFLTYFIRVLSPSGQNSGGELLKRAMADREERGCHHSLLGDIGRNVWNSTMEAQAILSLDDADAETAASAAHALAANGSAAIEPFLWKRLEQWSEHWRGRAAEFEVHPITGTIPSPESRLGPALFDSIASAKSWLLDEPRSQRLATLCIDEECRKQWASKGKASSILIDVSSGGGLYPAAFRLEGYQAPTLEALKDKIRQYPRGTEFRWCPQASNPFDGFSPGQRDEMFQDLKAFLSVRAMDIEPCAEDKCVPGPRY